MDSVFVDGLPTPSGGAGGNGGVGSDVADIEIIMGSKQYRNSAPVSFCHLPMHGSFNRRETGGKESSDLSEQWIAKPVESLLLDAVGWIL